MSTITELLETLPQQGKIEWIGLRPARREMMLQVEQVLASPDFGLEGDHYAGRSGNRQITLVQLEHLDVIASCLGLPKLLPETLRRNIVVRGINLLALKDKIMHVGGAELEITGACHPCSRMEELLGPGGYNAVRGHGGITARVVNEGVIAVGDVVSYPVTLTA